MTRAALLVIDSLGIGAAPDAARFGDRGADTLGHIAQAMAAGAGDERRPAGSLTLPNLYRLGLGEAARLATGRPPAGHPTSREVTGLYAALAERSRGKDTPSGHWEMAGLPVDFDWGYFPRQVPAFPEKLTAALIAAAELPGILGNCHASGTEIIAELGAEHLATGKPIVYTSADSVLQIAAHEEAFGLERLYRTCEIARRLVDPYRIGRVIARPFIGQPGGFSRTYRRRDYATPPPGPTLLDRLKDAGREVVGIGKIGDIFAGRGLTRSIKADGTEAQLAATVEALATLPDGGLVFTNFVDFDTLYGHRRDAVGYARELERFDALLPSLRATLAPGDRLYITADHGCDPTFKGTDHTREYVPLLISGPGLKPGGAGRRNSFADTGQTIAAQLGIAPLAAGTTCLAGAATDI